MRLLSMMGSVVFLLIGSSVVLAASEFKVEVTSATMNENGAELVVNFQDQSDATGLCDLYVKRMEYLQDFGALVVDVRPSLPCFNEGFGKRKGTLKWIVPEKLRDRAKLKLSINDMMIGMLSIERGSAQVLTTK